MRPPKIVALMASDFARLLAAGVPSIDAAAFVAPAYYESAERKDFRKWASVLANDRRTLDAVVELNGGQWIDLQPQERLVIARDKYLAECAYVLYTHSRAEADEDLARLMERCYERVVEYLKDAPDQSNSAFNRFIKQFAPEWKKKLPTNGPSEEAAALDADEDEDDDGPKPH